MKKQKNKEQETIFCENCGGILWRDAPLILQIEEELYRIIHHECMMCKSILMDRNDILKLMIKGNEILDGMQRQ